MTAALAGAVGTVVGLVVGTLGAGGGILTVPILVFALGFDPHSAATASLAIVGLSSTVALIPHARQKNVQVLAALVFAGVGASGAVAGARVADILSPLLLMMSLSGLLAVVSSLMFVQARRRGLGLGRQAARDRPRMRRIVLTVLLALLVGFLTGLLGVGGGFIVVPVLVLVLRLDMRTAVGTSLFVILLNSLTGLIARFGGAYAIDWGVVAVFAGASMVGGLLGARVSSRIPPDHLTTAFALLLAVVAVVTFVQTLLGRS